jgi:uncharacterized protein
MKFVPWQYIQDWKCDMCGICCKLYSVVIDFQEWLQIVNKFGVEKTAAGLDRFYIKRDSDGSCPFVYSFADVCLCGLQRMKPGACKQWPFKVLFEPRFGDANHALFVYGDLRLYVYADSMCSGLTYGNPRWKFASSTVREFVEITLGKCNTQRETTRALKLF